MEKCRFFKVAFIMLPLLLSSLWGFAQTQKVQGTVTDESGESLIGVNVVIQGTTNGTITNMEGKYEIDAEEGATLTFTYIGFMSQSVNVNGRTTIDVVMKEDATDLGEVVVIGYGVQRKEAVTGSVASMGGEELNEVASSNITQALQGRISGVELQQTSSKPGASMQIRIRGTRSLNASNDPLIVLDGIPYAGNIGDISPNDIKSLDILKDASATAIYGSRGANGVILITTNKGRKGQKPVINYSGYYGLKKVFSKYPMMDGPEFVQLRAAADQYGNGLDEFDDVNTDWQDMLFQTGTVTDHDMSIKGGTETGNYSFGMGYLKEESVMPIEDYTRFSLRASLDQEIGKYIRVGFSSNNNFSITNNSPGIYGVLSASPIADPYNDDGTMKKVVRMPLDENVVMTKDVLENLGDSRISEDKAFGTYNSLYGEVKIPGVEGLKYRMNVGLNYRQSRGGSYTGEGVLSTNETNPSRATLRYTNTTSWAIENLLSYDRTFAEKHRLNLVALYSTEEQLFHQSSVSVLDIPSDAFQFYNLGRAEGDITITPDLDANNNRPNEYYKSGLMSGMGRIMYSYDDKYMLTASYRADASSRLASGHQWVSYPAVSVGWNLHNESFMESVSLINMLKVRVGYGIASNESVDPYSTLGLLNTRPYNFGSDYQTGFYVSELPNPELGWEYSATTNYALEFSILNNRLSGTVEYYQTKTNDLLFRVSLPQTSGVNNIMQNIGKSENKGFEVSLNGVIIDNHNGFTWEAGINLYANRNKLTELASGQLEDKQNWWFVGHPIDVIYDYEHVGLWQEGEPYRDILEPGGNDGMIKVRYFGDYNADGSPTRAINADEDRVPISMEADFQGGFNTRLAYKGFDLNVVGAFKKGGILISTIYGAKGYLNILSGRRGNVKVDYWTPENPGAKYPAPGGIGGDSPRYLNTLSYFDASYLKVRTMTLGYNFVNNDFLKKAGIDKCRMYFTVQNPFVMFSPYHKESGMDPETNSRGNQNAAVPFNYRQRRLLTIGVSTPSTRNYLFGINLTF